jgi:hypothetical protein
MPLTGYGELLLVSSRTRINTWDEGKYHFIPLTDAIKDLLCEMEKVNSENGFIFASLRTQVKRIHSASITHYINDLTCNFVEYKGLMCVIVYKKIELKLGKEIIQFQHDWLANEKI